MADFPPTEYRNDLCQAVYQLILFGDNLWETLERRAEHIWAFPSAMMPSSGLFETETAGFSFFPLLMFSVCAYPVQ